MRLVDYKFHYVFHGVDLPGSSGDELNGICPFCDKDDHFYVNRHSGLYSCKKCHEEGNYATFFQKIWADAKTPQKHPDLDDRNIESETLQRWGLRVRDGELILPAYNKKRDLSALYYYRDVGNRRRWIQKGCSNHPWGVHLLDESHSDLWVCEGPWDAMALDQALDVWNGNRSTHAVLGLPGASQHRIWTRDYSECQTVRLVLDHDDAGRKGTDKALTTLGLAKSVYCMNWDDAKRRKQFTDGFDVSDLIAKDGPSKAVDYLQGRLGIVDVDPANIPKPFEPLTQDDITFLRLNDALPDGWHEWDAEQLHDYGRGILDKHGLSKRKELDSGFQIELVNFQNEGEEVEPIIDGILYPDQLLVIGGIDKALKTSLTVDLCISLATGTPFLKKFPVNRKMRCLFFSAESGRQKLIDTRRRILSSRGLTEADGFLLSVQKNLTISRKTNAKAIQKEIRKCRPDVVLIDPAYLILDPGGQEASKYAMGAVLRIYNDICDPALPMVVHHFNSSIKYGTVPQRKHLAYAGFAEYARQWILINRTREYESDGRHQLIMSCGGSHGHSNIWDISIDEGLQDNRLTTWDAEVMPHVSGKEKKKGAVQKSHVTRLVADVRKHPNSTVTDRKTRLGFSSTTYGDTKNAAIQQGALKNGSRGILTLP